MNDKTNKKLEKENQKLANLLAEVEPALATANGQVEDLRTAIDTMTSTIAELEETLANKDKTLDALRKELDAALATVRRGEGQISELRSDLRYEKTRREMAENKLFAADNQLCNVVNNHLPNNEAKMHAINRGIRLDRNGDFA